MNNDSYNIPRTSLSDEVYQRLTKMITSIKLFPGSRINFNELQQMFNVSLAPLREAVQRLMAKGLIISKPQKGYYIVELNEQDIGDLYQLRIMLETHALQRSINLIPKDKLKNVRNIIERELFLFNGKEDVKPTPAYRDADWYLHFTLIIGYSNSKIINQISSNLFEFIEITRNINLYVGKNSAKEHIEIIDAILQKKLELATISLETHLKIVERRIIRELQKMNGDWDMLFS